MTETEWTPGWKVLAERRSPCVTGLAGRHYPAWVIVRPATNCGPLAVFASEEDAVQWVDVIYRGRERARLNVVIVRCGAVGSTDTALWRPRHPDAAAVAAGLRQVIGEVMSYSLADCPPGTRLADAVCCWE